MGCPWLVLALGTAVILTAGPIGEAPVFIHKMWTLIFSWSGGREIQRDDYCRALGWMTLGTGCCVTSFGLTGFRRVPVCPSWLYRLAGRLKWSPAVAGFLLATLLLLAHKPRRGDRLLVEVAAPRGYKVEITAAGLRYTESQSYRESWDFLLGLAYGAEGGVLFTAVGHPNAEFVSALPRWTLRNWNSEWRSVTLEGGDSSSDRFIVNMDLVRGMGGAGGRLVVDSSSVVPCEPHASRQRCFELTSQNFSRHPNFEVHVDLTSILAGCPDASTRR